jgi:hypothetical protein
MTKAGEPTNRFTYVIFFTMDHGKNDRISTLGNDADVLARMNDFLLAAAVFT